MWFLYRANFKVNSPRCSAATLLSVQRQKCLHSEPLTVNRGDFPSSQPSRISVPLPQLSMRCSMQPRQWRRRFDPLNPPSTELSPPVVCAGRRVEEKWWSLHNRYLPPPLLTAGNSAPRQKLFRSRSWLWRLIESGWMWPSLKAEMFQVKVAPW